VTVCEQLDGTIRLRHQGRELAWEELPERPTPADRRQGQRPKVKPKANHAPWKPAAAAWEGTFLMVGDNTPHFTLLALFIPTRLPVCGALAALPTA
jgi:hypothetical protein